MANTDSMLQFTFAPAADPQERADGYGAGILFLNGAPFWYSNSQESPLPVEWTWVDLLEHIAAVWPALIVEQTYPFDWLNKSASHPGEMWEKAELRWSLQGDLVADVEEPLLYAFHNRHNLAAGWKGIGLPGLYWLRVGNSVWLSPEGESPIRANFGECMRALEAIGNQLADSYRGSDNVRVAAAVDAWDRRQQVAMSDFFIYATGLSNTELSAIEHGRPRAEFWGVSKFDAWQAAAANDNELLAAARMTKGILEPDAIAALIEIVRSLPRSVNPALDQIGMQAVKHLEKSDQASYAHESGYRLAEWLREYLGHPIHEPFDVESYLTKLGITTTGAKFRSDHIEALACLGPRGSCVVVNEDRAYAHSKQRLRMTLAHELCHFLVDRHTALPMAEVLGGSVDLYVERRAYAFAAELLLPRAAVAMAREKGEVSLAGKLRYLQEWFGVSKSVACAQIYNSPEYSLLTWSEREYVQRKLRSGEMKFLDEKVVSEIV